ncbi:MAG: hypothetical protein JWN90_339 [Parcubacteria group bacterium]|nr:hypothetical protein [Parcubacteria group bacterium]
MGFEDSSKNALPQQGDAGFATDEMIRELHEASEETAHTNSAELATESAPAAPVTPERHAEVMKAIGEEETRLEGNLATNREVVSAAEERLNAPVSDENPAKPLLSMAKIRETYKKTTQRIEEIALLGLIGTGGAFITGQITAGTGPTIGMDSDALEKAQHFVEMGRHIAESGLAVGVGVAAIAAIAQSMNWLRRRSQEKARYAAA